MLLKSSTESGDREARNLTQISKGQGMSNPLAKQSKYFAIRDSISIA